MFQQSSCYEYLLVNVITFQDASGFLNSLDCNIVIHLAVKRPVILISLGVSNTLDNNTHDQGVLHHDEPMCDFALESQSLLFLVEN